MKKKILFSGTLLFVLALILFTAVPFIEEEFVQKRVNNKVSADDAGCPESGGEWVGVGDFCIMKDEDGSSEKWEDAGAECFGNHQDSRLCTDSEWLAACKLSEGGGPLDILNMADDEEWVGDLAIESEAVVMGDNTACNIFGVAQIGSGGDSREFRCCINKQY